MCFNFFGEFIFMQNIPKRSNIFRIVQLIDWITENNSPCTAIFVALCSQFLLALSKLQCNYTSLQCNEDKSVRVRGHSDVSWQNCWYSVHKTSNASSNLTLSSVREIYSNWNNVHCKSIPTNIEEKRNNS